MACIFDLHIHSSYSSDGYYTPEEIYKRVNKLGVKYFAISDHNVIEGSKELYDDYQGDSNTFLIPSVEISVWYKSEEIHILAYGIDYNSTNLKSCLLEYKNNVPKHTNLRCQALRKAGFFIDDEELYIESKGAKPSTVTILNVMKKDNRNNKLLYEYFYGEKSTSPYMNFYLDYNAYGKPCYVDFALLDYFKIVEMLKSEAFLSIAHPMHYSEDILEDIIIDGIKGIEVYSTYKYKKPKEYYFSLADKYNLTVTGGSDFHGETLKPGIEIGDVNATQKELDKILESLHKYSKIPLVNLKSL